SLWNINYHMQIGGSPSQDDIIVSSSTINTIFDRPKIPNVGYVGDAASGSTIDIRITVFDRYGSPVNLSGIPDVIVGRGNSTDISSTGVSISQVALFTGRYNIRIDLSSTTWYE